MPSGVMAFCPKCGRTTKPVYGDLTDEYKRVGRSLDSLDDLDMADIVQNEEDWRAYYDEQVRLAWERERAAMVAAFRRRMSPLREFAINGIISKAYIGKQGAINL